MKGLCFIFPHLPGDEKKNIKKLRRRFPEGRGGRDGGRGAGGDGTIRVPGACRMSRAPLILVVSRELLGGKWRRERGVYRTLHDGRLFMRIHLRNVLRQAAVATDEGRDGTLGVMTRTSITSRERSVALRSWYCFPCG